MKKTKKLLSGVGLALSGLFLSTSQAHADIPASSGIVGVLQDQPVETRIPLLLIGVGLVIGVIVLVSWVILRAIKRKKNGIVK